ncbi:MAG: hypothetical protein DIU67_009870 [Actinomycetes bacterium]|jgi:uncharacterized membrane protein
MKRARSLLNKAVLVAILVFLFTLALPAFAQEGTTTTVATENIVPAIPVETLPEADNTPQWTYRYLIPTGLVIAGLVIVVTSVKYFTDVVRKRYRIVEE